MHKKFVTGLIFGIIVLLGLIGYQLSVQNKKQIAPNPAANTTPDATPARQAQTIVTHSGAAYSAAPIIENKNTTVVASNLYKNTVNTDTYDIMFNDDNGVGIILLYNENLKVARAAAEKQLLSILPNTQQQICDMDIRVQTNENVSKVYSGINLGLSFCPGSVTLP